jgi:hypothetical protein
MDGTLTLQSLRPLIPPLATFVLSFIMVGVYWIAHQFKTSLLRKWRAIKVNRQRIDLPILNRENLSDVTGKTATVRRVQLIVSCDASLFSFNQNISHHDGFNRRIKPLRCLKESSLRDA